MEIVPTYQNLHYSGLVKKKNGLVYHSYVCDDFPTRKTIARKGGRIRLESIFPLDLELKRNLRLKEILGIVSVLP